MKTLFLCLLLGASLATTNGFAEACKPSWCDTPNAKLNPTEQTICQHSELQVADHLLNQIYQSYHQSLQGEARQKLINAQQQWRLEERDLLSDKYELLASILERVMQLNFMHSVVDNP